jgi:hypothetical protein
MQHKPPLQLKGRYFVSPEEKIHDRRCDRIRVIAAHLARKAGFRAKRARTGAVTLIQRFGSALNLNLHFHMLFLDGVYV